VASLIVGSGFVAAQAANKRASTAMSDFILAFGV
jgi:hypothetical protein